MTVHNERDRHDEMAAFWESIGNIDRIEDLDDQREADRIDHLMSIADLEAAKRRKEYEEVEGWLAEEREFYNGVENLRTILGYSTDIRTTTHLAWALHSMEFDEMYPF